MTSRLSEATDLGVFERSKLGPHLHVIRSGAQFLPEPFRPAHDTFVKKIEVF